MKLRLNKLTKIVTHEPGPTKNHSLFTRNATPGGLFFINPVLHVHNILPEFEHFPHLLAATRIDKPGRRELRSSRSPILCHLAEVADIRRKEGVGVKNEFFHVDVVFESEITSL